MQGSSRLCVKSFMNTGPSARIPLIPNRGELVSVSYVSVGGREYTMIQSLRESYGTEGRNVDAKPEYKVDGTSRVSRRGHLWYR